MFVIHLLVTLKNKEMNKASITQFKQFLIAEGAKKEYIEMMRLRAKNDERRGNKKFYVHDFFVRQRPGCWLSALTVWDTTREGHKFWSRLS